jgi:hypothetical protein
MSEHVHLHRENLRDHPADSWLDLAPANRCLVGFNAGPPLTPGGYNQNMQVVQTKDYVAMLTEMVHTVRGYRSTEVRA